MSDHSFGKWIKGWRESRKLSSRHLSVLLGLSQTYIWKLENRKLGPSLRFLRKFASVFEEPEVYLAAGRLIPEEELKKIKNPNLLDKLLNVSLDEHSTHFYTTYNIDDPELSKFIIDIYTKLKKVNYDKKDFDFITNVITGYFSAKEKGSSK